MTAFVYDAVRTPFGKFGGGLAGVRPDDLAAVVLTAIREPFMAASSDDPHSRFIVVPGTETGKPASRVAIRATLRLSSPAPLALPRTTSSTSAGSRSVRSSAARSTPAARSSGRVLASAPPKRPNGVRTAL